MRRAATCSFAILAIVVLLVGVGGTVAGVEEFGGDVSVSVDGASLAGLTDGDPAVDRRAAIAPLGHVANDVEFAETAADCESANDTEVIGCWNGIHHGDDPADLGIEDGGEGLSETDLANLTYLKMARVEYIRERPFKSNVTVDTMTREEFREGFGTGASDPVAPPSDFDRWNDQVWKALFIIGEDESSDEVINDVFSGAVAGFYSPSEERIVIVIDDEEAVTVSPSTLLHELGHAMQDQYEGLNATRFNGATQDAELGINGIVEGEVVYLEEVYAERCSEEWVCTAEPESTGGGATDTSDPNLGVLLLVLQPYSDGAPYVDELIEAGGWEAVDALMAEPPTTTRETIHREPFTPTPIEFTDTSTDEWTMYADQGVDGADTVGEASLFVTMWYQSATYNAGVIDYNHITPDNNSHPYQDYDYSHPVSNGWVNDKLYPYRTDADGEERDGYVWVIEWESVADAAEFDIAYRRVLDAHDAEYRDDGLYTVGTGDFRGTYGLERDGTTVTITHALEPSEVFELRPALEPADGANGGSFPGVDEPDEENDMEFPGWTPPAEYIEEPQEPPEPPTDDDTAGLGVVLALIAIVVATLSLGRTRREP